MFLDWLIHSSFAFKFYRFIIIKILNILNLFYIYIIYILSPGGRAFNYPLILWFILIFIGFDFSQCQFVLVQILRLQQRQQQLQFQLANKHWWCLIWSGKWLVLTWLEFLIFIYVNSYFYFFQFRQNWI